MKIIFPLCILGSILGPCAYAQGIYPRCSHAFLAEYWGENYEPFNRFRKELALSEQVYLTKFGPQLKIEKKELFSSQGESLPGFNRSGLSANPVLYLSSGADIYTPLILFPMAKDYHFVDRFNGWDTAKQHITSEILRRLESLQLAGDSHEINIEMIQKNFHYRAFDISWYSDALKTRMHKTFHFHNLDFNNLSNIRKMLKVIAKTGELGSVLNLKEPIANLAGMGLILAKVKPGGFFLTSRYENSLLELYNNEQLVSALGFEFRVIPQFSRSEKDEGMLARETLVFTKNSQ